LGSQPLRALAKDGANVMLNGFGDKAEIEKHAPDRKGLRRKGALPAADMSKPAEIAEMVRTTEKEFGALDVLVNNAGIQHVANVEDFPIEKWDAVIAVNLSSSFHTIRATVPGMKARNWGRIINIASAHGLVASGQKVAYVSAKHGLVGLTKVIAIETANSSITCNAICPGWVLTPLIKQQIETRAKANGQSFDQAKVSLVREAADARLHKAESIGALTVFLAATPRNHDLFCLFNRWRLGRQ
jgi:3-hydroxybutyrate dehydrogenase